MRTTDSAIILAGGRSLRMGFDKQLLRLNDEYLLEGNIRILLEIFPEVIVVANEPETLDQIPGMDRVRVVSDEYAGAGPLAGIHAGLKAASSDYALILACDMPVLDQAYLLRMKEMMTESAIGDGLINVNAASGEPEPFFAFYGRHLIPELEVFIQSHRRSLRHFIDQHDFLRVTYPADDAARDIFFNINDRRELRQYQETTQPLALHLSRLEDDLAPVIQSVPVIRYKGNTRLEVADEIVTEAELRVFLDDQLLQTMYCTPTQIEELIVGNLHAQGLITDPAQVRDIQVQPLSSSGVALEVRITTIGAPARDSSAGRIITTSGASFQPQANVDLHRPDRSMTLDISRITAISAAFQDTSALFARTGGNHACALIREGEMILFREDIGRHNALDKLIGWALLDGIDLAACLILLSGRMASEMTMKVLRTPVTALLSRAAPTDRSIRLARDYNLTMMGFIRGDRLNIYNLNGGHMIQSPEEPSPSGQRTSDQPIIDQP